MTLYVACGPINGDIVTGNTYINGMEETLAHRLGIIAYVRGKKEYT